MYNLRKGKLYVLFILLMNPFWVSFLTSIFAFQTNGFHPYTMQFAFQFLSFLVPFFCYLRISNQRVSQVLKLKKLDLKNVFFIICMCILIQPMVFTISAITSIFFTNNVSYYLSMYISANPLWLTLLLMAVTPALCEEIAFRGVVYKHFEKLPIRSAAIANGFFFGLMHLNYHQFFYAFVLGIVFAYFVFYTGSILSSMLAHFFINGIQTVIAYSAAIYDVNNASTSAFKEVTFNELLPVILTFGFLSALITPLAIYVFKKFKLHNQTLKLKESFEDNLENEPEPADLLVEDEDEKMIDCYFYAILGAYVLVLTLGRV